MNSVLNHITINLTGPYCDKYITYDGIADSLNIAWEGTAEKAKLYMSATTQSIVLALVYPMKERLFKSPTVIGVSSIYNLKACVVTRFRELSDEAKSSYDALPGFFTADQLFGGCE
ncbi:hypothetical protein GN958_ATG20333 [Phytophthora infestans]|uniref:Uncharacterized protein n=1 Tax=Phytophthora infestans TaxID=4787 RepID=A0A8S9TUL2_PHYIN|nr:hypothetical protein GN958_ATG20333 [Phytophthora infestans]